MTLQRKGRRISFKYFPISSLHVWCSRLSMDPQWGIKMQGKDASVRNLDAIQGKWDVPKVYLYIFFRGKMC